MKLEMNNGASTHLYEWVDNEAKKRGGWQSPAAALPFSICSRRPDGRFDAACLRGALFRLPRTACRFRPPPRNARRLAPCPRPPPRTARGGLRQIVGLRFVLPAYASSCKAS
jgi:hypothetical protein